MKTDIIKKSKKPLVSIIICTLKDNNQIDCIPNLKKQSYKNFEVIVRKDKGLAKARNEGIKQSKGEVIAFIDDDAIPKKDWVEKILNNLKNEMGITGMCIHPKKDIFKEFNIPYYQGDKPRYTKLCCGCNMAFRKNIFNEIGLFDPYFDWGGEETEFSIRFLKKYKLKYCPDVVVTHLNARNLKHYLKKQYLCGKNDLYFWRKAGYSLIFQLFLMSPLPSKNRINIVKSVSSTQKLSTVIKKTIIFILGKIAEDCGIFVSLIKKKK